MATLEIVYLIAAMKKKKFDPMYIFPILIGLTVIALLVWIIVSQYVK